jgi:membrane protein involved in colicin uptake
MPQIRAGAADRWKRRTASAQGDYASGVQNSRKDWAANTAAAEGAYQTGVQDAMSRGAFGKGVAKAGNARYKAGVQAKGIARFAQGVQASGDRYAQGFAPYAQVIESTQLPARGRRGDPANYQRAVVMGTALHDAKRSQQGT